MPRKKRPLEREHGVVRDASLLVVACEDTHAVKQYFSRFRTKKVQFVVLPTEDGCYSPESVLDRLDKYRCEEATEENDQLWLCIDTDHWISNNHIANLTEVLRECRQKGYRVAISNPCFELWLLLHFSDSDLSLTDCDAVVKALRHAAGRYRKNRCDLLQIEASQVMLAVQRAKQLDESDELIPLQPATRVYLLIEELVSRDLLRLH